MYARTLPRVHCAPRAHVIEPLAGRVRPSRVAAVPRVRIIAGSLKGLSGRVIEAGEDRWLIAADECKLLARVSREMLEPLAIGEA